jgi:pyrroloquinoline quinone biosynthesis protein D
MPEVTARDSRPRLAAKARLRYDRKAERYMLLYPEKGLVLNPTGADIVQLCTGENTVGGIVDQLAAKYGRDAPAIEREVVDFLAALAERSLLQETPP